jgi:hypothetical protein
MEQQASLEGAVAVSLGAATKSEAATNAAFTIKVDGIAS